MIERLKNHQVDKSLWDEAITSSDHPFVYLLSWYLDVVSPNWEAYMDDGYKFVFPLPVKHKWKIPYLVQPPFCQKIGVTGIGVTSETATKFYQKAYRQFPYLNLQVRDSLGLEKRKYLNGRINYTLDLSEEFQVLEKNFSENTRRNIKKARTANQELKPCSVEDFGTFCKRWLMGVNKDQLKILHELTKTATQKEIAKVVKVTDTKGEVTAAACFLVWNYQVVYLAGASSAEGKQSSAMFLVMEHIIRQYAATGYLLDFEGSNIPGVAKFFRGFGGKASYYYHLKRNWFGR